MKQDHPHRPSCELLADRRTFPLALHPGSAHIIEVVCRGFLSSPTSGSGGVLSSTIEVTKGRRNSNAGDKADSLRQLGRYSLKLSATGLVYASISLRGRQGGECDLTEIQMVV